MADDNRQRQQCNPNPLGGAAIRQIRGRDQSAFTRPMPQGMPPPEESQSVWTQFSGIPSHSGSQSSLHDWLHSLDDTSYNPNPGFHSFTQPPSDSQRQLLDSFSGMDFSAPELSPDANHDAVPPFNLGQFEFSGLQNFGLPSDYHVLQSPQYDHVSSSQFIPSAADFMIPTADIHHPPPGPSYTSHVQPDFSLPPPSYVPEMPLFSSSPADAHAQGLPDLFASHAKHTYHNDGHFYNNGQLGSNSLDFDAADALPPMHSTASGLDDISISSHTFGSFPLMADDILFPNASVVDGKSKTFGFEHPSNSQKKIFRQSSEPVSKGATAEDGKAIYVEALRRLNSFGTSAQTYEPFRSGVQVQEELLTGGKKPSDGDTVNKPAARKEPPRMTYSDVAKAARGKASQVKAEPSACEKVEPDFGPLKTSTESMGAPRFQRHSAAKRQAVHPRSSVHRGKAVDGVAANSRYGLDQFDDTGYRFHADGEGGSAENAMQTNSPHHAAGRRSNNSSTMALDDSLLSSQSTGCGDSARFRATKDHHPKPREGVQNHSVYTTSTAQSVSNEHSSKVGSASASPPLFQGTKGEKLFFDPKRIFQRHGGIGSGKPQVNASIPNKTRASEDKKKCESEGSVKAETVLNNGKPNNTTSKATAATHRKADYINNDLREGATVINPSTANISGASGHVTGTSNKRTNQTIALGRHGHSTKKQCSRDGAVHNSSSAEKSKGGDSRSEHQDSEHHEDNSFFRNIDWDLVDEWMKYLSDCSMSFARTSFSALLTLMIYLLGIIMYLALGAIHLIALLLGKIWSMVKTHIFKNQGQDQWNNYQSATESARRRFGLEENITLPSTGEEAMKRLLACKGKDPYSILGLKSDATDDDIKRYYRRQAFLVHPDKNQEPGAEEAFKILGHAFEKIGDPTKRKEYDLHVVEASEAEAAMREFSDLLTKLQERVQEAANLMRCEHCGGKHRRIPVDRQWYAARFCDRCNVHHSAREGDVWAESSMLGFLWHYYACMESKIFDITEWVSCQSENFKHMKANAHPVFYRIQTDGSRRHRQGQSGEADLEDFINRLFSKAQDSAYPGFHFPGQQSGRSGDAAASSQSAWTGGASSTATNPGAASKRSRRKKKKN